MSSWVPVYAAAVATAGLLWACGWAIYTWRRLHSTLLDVKLGYTYNGNATYVRVTVVNHSQHSVVINDVRLASKTQVEISYGRSRARDPHTHKKPIDLPVTIEARDRKEFLFDMKLVYHEAEQLYKMAVAVDQVIGLAMPSIRDNPRIPEDLFDVTAVSAAVLLSNRKQYRTKYRRIYDPSLRNERY